MKPALRLVLRRPDPARFEADADEVAALFVAARRAALPGLREAHTEAEIRAWMRETVFPRQSVRLACLRDEIVGFAARDGAWLAHLYVKPGWTGHQIGQELLDATIAEATPLTPVLRLWTFQRNAGARRFYEGNGFVVAREGDGKGNEEGEPDILYERQLRG
ncbi:MAG: GNAT family N-acetyltransferase [Betaproteobacteria bacterium]